jgi:GNAT superfamily N-acetyltransferase
MFQLHIYRSSAELPLHFYYQAQSFVRIVFVDSEDYDIDGEIDTPFMHVVLAKGKTLVSYCQVLWRMLELGGSSYKCYGLSGVMTYPAFRRRGFGGQVIEAAASLIREDPMADVALFWTAHHNVHFYAGHGWEAMPGLVTTVGDPANPQVYDEEMRMMMFLSERGKAAHRDFECGRVYVGDGTW